MGKSVNMTKVTTLVGCGRDGHGIVRRVVTWWDDQGHCIAEHDPSAEWMAEQHKGLAVVAAGQLP